MCVSERVCVCVCVRARRPLNPQHEVKGRTTSAKTLPDAQAGFKFL